MSIAESAPGKAPLPCVPALTALPALQGPCSAAPGSELLMTGAGLSVSAAPPEAQCLSSAQRGDDELAQLGVAVGGTALLKLQCANTSPGDLVKTQILTQQVWAWPESLHIPMGG